MLATWSIDGGVRRTWVWKAISCLSPCRSDSCKKDLVKDSRLAFRVHEALRMSEQELCMCPAANDQASAPAAATERPLKMSVVFDDDASAQSAEVLIRHVASDYECDWQSFSFDELDAPAPGVAAARSACNSDIIVFAVRDNRTLPSHVKSWLGLCIGLREEDQEGALVALIAEAAQTSNPGSSLLEYLETVAVVGRMAFFPRRQSFENQLSPGCEHLEPEDKLCGSSD
jgi:hypothetical protein